MCVFGSLCMYVSYLQTCLPVCLGRGNHYAYYSYRHHEGKNLQHLLLCLLLLQMELQLGLKQILIRNPHFPSSNFYLCVGDVSDRITKGTL